jgi:sugar/nucleoside kinase (ribokinase family)
VRDIVPDGWRIGGTVSFAAVQADRLGLSVGVLTRAGDDLDVASQLPFANVVQLPSPRSTVFENHYVGGERKQRVHAQAGMITPDDLPIAWRSAMVALVGPVLGEIDPSLASAFDDQSLVGVSPQGWLRALDAEGNVRRSAYGGAPFWRGADVVFVSDEDLVGGRDGADPWTREVAVVAMTESHRGAQVWADGRWRRIDAFPEDEVDPTGAGDTFATAFLIRLHETADVYEAARFGAAAASLSISGVGAAAMPVRAEIEKHMRRYPEVALR